MIGQAVSAYQKLHMDLITKFSVGNDNLMDEVPFFDEGYISTQIERLKRKHEDFSRELKISVELNSQSDYEVKKREKLKFMLEKTELKMVYLALNSFKSIEMCKSLVRGKEYKVQGLINALDAYQIGNEEKAKKEFEMYFSINTIESGYYLANKTYGKILLKMGDNRKALQHFESAIQFKVDDVELLSLLQNTYANLEMIPENQIVSEVLDILR